MKPSKRIQRQVEALAAQAAGVDFTLVGSVSKIESPRSYEGAPKGTVAVTAEAFGQARVTFYAAVDAFEVGDAVTFTVSRASDLWSS